MSWRDVEEGEGGGGGRLGFERAPCWVWRHAWWCLWLRTRFPHQDFNVFVYVIGARLAAA